MMFKQVTLADHMYVSQLLSLGNAAFKEGKNEEAMAHYQRVLLGTSSPQVRNLF